MSFLYCFDLFPLIFEVYLSERKPVILRDSMEFEIFDGWGVGLTEI